MPKEIPLLRGQVALVDAQDYDWLMQYRWRLNTNGYVVRSCRVGDRTVIVCMHRQIMNAQRGHVVDHIDHNRLNNTRSNLRFVTQQQNLMYRRRFKNNSTGYKGVNVQNGRWHARFEFNQKTIHLGYFDDVESAAMAYDAAVRRVFGIYALVNFPDAPAMPEIEARVESMLSRHGL